MNFARVEAAETRASAGVSENESTEPPIRVLCRAAKIDGRRRADAYSGASGDFRGVKNTCRSVKIVCRGAEIGCNSVKVSFSTVKVSFRRVKVGFSSA
jgi:hypothetical protein